MFAAYFALPRAWRNGVLFRQHRVLRLSEAKYLALVLGSVAFNWSIRSTLAAGDTSNPQRSAR